MNEKPTLAPDDARRRSYEAALARGRANLDALPVYAHAFAQRWLPGIERLGRIGIHGDAAGLAGRFVAELAAAFEEQWQLYAASDPARVADRTTRGSGV